MKYFRLILSFILAAFILSAASPLAGYQKTVCYTEYELGLAQYKICMTAKHTWTNGNVTCTSAPSLAFTPYQQGWSYNVRERSCLADQYGALSTLDVDLHNSYFGLDAYEIINIDSEDDTTPPNWTVWHWWNIW